MTATLADTRRLIAEVYERERSKYVDQHIELHWRRLTPNPLNRLVRGEGEEDVSELAESIKANGVIEQLVVVPHPNPLPGKDGADHMIICGEQRWRAVQLLGDEAPLLPCLVKPAMSDPDQLVMMGVENLQRNGLNPVAEARYYKALFDAMQWEGAKPSKVVGEMVRRTGIRRDKIDARMRLLALHPRVLELMETGGLPVHAAAALKRLPAEVQGEMADKLAGRSMAGIERAVQIALERMEREAERVTGREPAAGKNGKGPGTTAKQADPESVTKDDILKALKATCAACEAQREMRHEIPWEGIEAAQAATCRRCDVRDIQEACGQCPMGEFLRELRNLAVVPQGGFALSGQQSAKNGR